MIAMLAYIVASKLGEMTYEKKSAMAFPIPMNLA